jgi:flagellar protein FlgJ
MQAEQLANTMAQNGGLGIADQLLGDMIAMQEAAQKTQLRATGVYR